KGHNQKNEEIFYQALLSPHSHQEAMQTVRPLPFRNVSTVELLLIRPAPSPPFGYPTAEHSAGASPRLLRCRLCETPSKICTVYFELPLRLASFLFNASRCFKADIRPSQYIPRLILYFFNFIEEFKRAHIFNTPERD